MSGMMRFKSDKDFQAMLKQSHLKVAGGIVAKVLPPAPTRIVDAPAKSSDLEELFAQQLSLTKLPPPIRQYAHLRGSKHTLDFAWPDHMLGVEVQGMVHRIKGTFKADLKKRYLGQVQGWTVLEVGGAEIREGVAMDWLHQLWALKVGAV